MTLFRNLLLPFLFAGIGSAALAQPKGYHAVASASAFQQLLSTANAGTQSLQADFTQTKVLTLLAEKVISKGKFSYRRQDKVRIEYTSPYPYLMVMNGGQVLVKDEQKTSKINTRSSKTLQSVNRIMIDCMRGTVFSNSDFTPRAYEGPGGYLLSLKPATTAIQKLFLQIDVYLDKRLEVTKLVLTEPGGDYTEMSFRNTLHNTLATDALFSAR